MANAPSVSDSVDNDMNIVGLWLRKDPIRWAAGVLAGLLSGVVAQAVAGIVSIAAGYQVTFPAKLMATVFLGAGATDLNSGMGAVVVGFLFLEVIFGFFGFVYAHFFGTNSPGPLLAAGLVWSAFSWVFLWNLFFQAWDTIFAAQVSAGAVFPVCLAYGVSLSSVAFFDRMLRGK